MRKTLLAIAALALFPTSLWAQAPAGGCAEVPGQGMLCSTPFTFGNNVELTPVATSALPTCNAASKGAIRVVQDATTPTYNGALTGGSNVTVMVLCSGTAWLTH
jgi:hypothetical protein